MEEPSKISLRLFQRKLPWRGPSKHSLKKKSGLYLLHDYLTWLFKSVKMSQCRDHHKAEAFQNGAKIPWIRIWNLIKINPLKFCFMESLCHTAILKYFEFLRLFSKKQNIIKKKYQLNRNKNVCWQSPAMFCLFIH